MTARPFDLGRYLLVRHVAAGVVLVALVSTCFYLVVRGFVVTDAEDGVIDLASQLVAEAERAGLDLPPSAESLADTRALLRAQQRSFRLRRLDVWDARGVPSCSSESTPRERGGELVRDASRGRSGAALEGGLLVAAVPLLAGRRVVGAFSIERSARPLVSRLRTLRDVVLGGSAVIALALASLVVLIGRLADRLIGEERAIRRRHEERLRDIADELEREVAQRTEQLRTERDRLRTITDHVPSAFRLVADDRSIQLATRSFEDLVGRTADVPRGLACGLCGMPHAEDGCLVDRALATGAAQRTEWRFGGESDPAATRWLEQVVLPVRGAGAPGAAIEVVSDVTARKQMEEGMIRSAKLATLGEMAAVVAHEIRNSMNSTKLLLQLMSEDPERAPGREPLGVALGSMGRAERLITDLLKFARPAPAAPRVSSVEDALREAVLLVRHQAERGGVSVDVETNGTALAVFDPDQIRECLVNLLLNAFAATPSGGGVRVFAGRAPAPRDLLDAAEIVFPRGAPTLRLGVADDGAGMTPEQAARAFDPFFTTRQDGTGLGLPTVRRIVSEHDGVVTLETEPGAGTTVQMWLPWREVPADA